MWGYTRIFGVIRDNKFLLVSVILEIYTLCVKTVLAYELDKDR